jgi:GAF domain-containing protein
MIGPGRFPRPLFELSSLLLGDETMHSILQRIVDLTVAAVPGASHCGVSLLSEEHVTTAAATDGTTLQLDGAQYSNGEGPCLEAARTGQMIRVEKFSHDGRYPKFAAEALRLGSNSSLSFPLIVNDTSIGALNIYGQDDKALYLRQ